VKRIVVVAFALISTLNTANSREYMGYKVVNVPFPIAGGETVRLPVTEVGAIPAENRKALIEVAGFSVGPSNEDPKQAVLRWHFGFTSKRLKDLESVEVAEVSPSDVVVPLVLDLNPRLSEDYWMGSVSGGAVGPETTPWLYSEKASIYIFRFTLVEKRGKHMVLYQPAWFSAEAKEQFRAIAARITEG